MRSIFEYPNILFDFSSICIGPLVVNLLACKTDQFYPHWHDVQRGSKFCFVVVLVVLGENTLIKILHYCPISPCFQPFSILHHCMQPCPAALPGSLARQPCPVALPGSFAGQPCLAAMTLS
jgi:hypothetical protein